MATCNFNVTTGKFKNKVKFSQNKAFCVKQSEFSMTFLGKNDQFFMHVLKAPAEHFFFCSFVNKLPTYFRYLDDI